MKTVEEAAGVRPTARPARLRRGQLRPRPRLRLRLRLRVWAADWANCQARQAECASLLSFINFPFDDCRSLCWEKGEPKGWLR